MRKVAEAHSGKRLLLMVVRDCCMTTAELTVVLLAVKTCPRVAYAFYASYGRATPCWIQMHSLFAARIHLYVQVISYSCKA